jgi:hypothetical protein
MKLTTSKNSLSEDLKNISFPALMGSEKQISLANSIRNSALRDLVIEALAVHGRDKELTVEIDDRVLKALSMHESARFIIENKHHYQFTGKKLAKVTQ